MGVRFSRGFRRLACIIVVAAACGTALAATAEPAQAGDAKKIVFIAGRWSHPPGTHEPDAGLRLLKYCIDNAQNITPVNTAIHYRWPKDDAALDGAATIVLIGDGFPPITASRQHPRAMGKVQELMQKGCGIVCLHAATWLGNDAVTPDGKHPGLCWFGGYFAGRKGKPASSISTCEATFVPDGDKHPIHRGWKAFTCQEEIYFDIVFGRDGMPANVTSIAYCMVPLRKPNKETVCWAIERKDGGRGVGFVAPHFYCNWQLDDMRALVLNCIVWTAGMDVPSEGVQCQLPDLKTFDPKAVDFTPRPRNKGK